MANFSSLDMGELISHVNDVSDIKIHREEKEGQDGYIVALIVRPYPGDGEWNSFSQFCDTARSVLEVLEYVFSGTYQEEKFHSVQKALEEASKNDPAFKGLSL